MSQTPVLVKLVGEKLAKMFTVSFYIDPRSHTKKGYPVKLQVFFTKPKTNKRKSIGLYLPRKNSKLTPEMNARLVEYQLRSKYADEKGLGFEDGYNIILNGIPEVEAITKEQQIIKLERQLKALKEQVPQPIIPFLEAMIEERQLQGKSTRHFEELVSEINKWQPDMDFNDLTYDSLRSYERFKRQNSSGRGVMIQKAIRTLKTVFNEAKRCGKVYDKSTNPFDGFKVNVVADRRKKKPIMPEQLHNFFAYKPSGSTTKKNKANIQRVLSLFAFQILIGGHDLADVAALKWTDIVDGRIQFRRFKLRNQGGGRQVNNVILEESQAIIDTYGTRESERIFSFLNHPTSGRYQEQVNNYGKTLQRISKSLSLPSIRSKKARTIFRSAGGALGVNDLLLMQIQAHKPSGVTFNYQTDLRLEEQDRVHGQIIDFLFNPDAKIENKERSDTAFAAIQSGEEDLFMEWIASDFKGTFEEYEAMKSEIDPVTGYPVNPNF